MVIRHRIVRSVVLCVLLAHVYVSLVWEAASVAAFQVHGQAPLSPRKNDPDDGSSVLAFDMAALEQCQMACEEPASLQASSAVAWSLVLSIPDYQRKWDRLRALFDDEGIASLADLTADQVRRLLPHLNPGDDGGTHAPPDGGERALQWIGELTEVQEDALDDEIDGCYARCSAVHPLEVGGDPDGAGFPALARWVSGVLRDDAARSADGAAFPWGARGSVARPSMRTAAPGSAAPTEEPFAALLRRHLPVPARHDDIRAFADDVAAARDVGLYYVGADSWSLSVVAVAACAVGQGLRFAHLDVGQELYASYTRGLPSVLLSSCSFDELDACLYHWDAGGRGHPVACCHAAVYRAWPLCESPLWSVERLRHWITEALPLNQVMFRECPFTEQLPLLFSGYEDRQYDLYCNNHTSPDVTTFTALPDQKKDISKSPTKKSQKNKSKKKKKRARTNRRKIWVPDVGWVFAHDSSSEGRSVLTALLVGALALYVHQAQRYARRTPRGCRRTTPERGSVVVAAAAVPARKGPQPKGATPKKRTKRRPPSKDGGAPTPRQDDDTVEAARQKAQEKTAAFQQRETVRQMKLREEFEKAETCHGKSKKKRKSPTKEHRSTRSHGKPPKSPQHSPTPAGSPCPRPRGQTKGAKHTKPDKRTNGTPPILSAPTDAQRAEASRQLAHWQAAQLARLVSRRHPDAPSRASTTVTDAASSPGRLPPATRGSHGSYLSSHSESDDDYHYTFALPDILDELGDTERLDLEDLEATDLGRPWHTRDTAEVAPSHHNPWHHDRAAPTEPAPYDWTVRGPTHMPAGPSLNHSLEETAADVLEGTSPLLHWDAPAPPGDLRELLSSLDLLPGRAKSTMSTESCCVSLLDGDFGMY